MLIQKERNTTTQLEQKKILLVGLDEVDLMLLRYLISQQGGHMLTNNDMARAIDTVENGNYDLLIIDTQLDEINTVDLVQRLRREKKLNVPVIGITSRNDFGERTIPNGFDYLIMRPIEKHKFHRALENLIST